MVLKALIFRLRARSRSRSGTLPASNFQFGGVRVHWAVLPIPAGYLGIIPTDYRYRGGAYNIAYLYDGNIYSGSGSATA